MPIHRLTLTNLLSFGPGESIIELGPLNVLIGPNGSGKSNVVDVLALLGSMPHDLALGFRSGGGTVRDWRWVGHGSIDSESAITTRTSADGTPEVEHRLSFAEHGFRPRVVHERIAPAAQTENASPPFAFAYVRGKPTFRLLHAGGVPIEAPDVNSTQSVLAQRKDAYSHPELGILQQVYNGIFVFRGWNWTRNSPLRAAQFADQLPDFLLPSAENLAVVLSSLQLETAAWGCLIAAMRRFLPEFEDLRLVSVASGLAIYFVLRGHSAPIGMSRLSDGTLHYLSLLTVLLHPKPPGIICIEEPEAGLHPDMIAELAKHIEDAATRTQVVITTHSDLLVSALSHRPEDIIVVERGENGTELTRLEPARLAKWLEKYSLGELWLKGEIGGSR